MYFLFQKCISDTDEPVLQTASFEALVKFGQLCPYNFNNFTGSIISTLLSLSINELCEVAAQEALQDLIQYLPPSQFTDSVCGCIEKTQDVELLNTAFNVAIQLPRLIVTYDQVIVYEFFERRTSSINILRGYWFYKDFGALKLLQIDLGDNKVYY